MSPALLLWALLSLGLADVPEPAAPDALVTRVCSQCHATSINGGCVAGDCRVEGKPVIRAEGQDWGLAVDFMVDALRCKMTPEEQKMITEFLARHYPGPVYPVTWTEVLTTPRGSGWNIVSLTVWGDQLYFGTEGGGRIFRSGDGTSWEEVADTGHDKVYGLTRFRGALYVGTYNPQPQIWRSTDGRDWSQVAVLPPNQRGITALGVFGDRLYAGTGSARIYRSRDGMQWEEAGVLKVDPKGSTPNVGEDNWPYWVRFLKEFRGMLYAGLEGGGVYRTADGTTWSEVALPIKERPGVRGAAVFKGSLYVGTTGTGAIWRSRDGLRWEAAWRHRSGRGYTAAMTVYEGMLYASIDGEVLRSRDGRHWEAVGKISPKTIEAMEVFGRYLYAGTDRPVSAQLYRTTGLTPSRVFVPDRDIPMAGKITGSYKDVQTGYHLYEVLEASATDGVSILDHKWEIRHPGGARLLLAVRGYHTPSADGDNFLLSYSTDDRRYTDMFTLIATEEGRRYQLFALPALPKGRLYIRVRSTGRVRGDPVPARLYLDHLYALVEGRRS